MADDPRGVRNAPASAIDYSGRPGLRRATTKDLQDINRIVEYALATWGISHRVMRLALPSLHYNLADFEQMTFLLATDSADQVIGVAAWETLSERIDKASKSQLSVHGLYVAPEWQRCGIGASLVQWIENMASHSGIESLVVNAWRDAESFFRAQGFRPCDDTPLYPRRMGKRLINQPFTSFGH